MPSDSSGEVRPASPTSATAKLDRVIEETAANTTQMSTLVRTTAVGVLAVAWGFLVTPSQRIPSPPPLIILTVIVLVIVGLFFDWMQYLAAYLDSNARRKAMERDSSLRGWDPTTRCYKCREWCFRLKQVFIGLAAVLLVAGLTPSIVRLGMH